MKQEFSLLLLLLLLCAAPAARGETITMTFVGDCTLGCDITWLKDARAFTNVIDREGMDYPFALVRDVFERDDLTVVNLEGVLADTNEGRMGGRTYIGYHFQEQYEIDTLRGLGDAYAGEDSLYLYKGSDSDIVNRIELQFFGIAKGEAAE